MAVALKEFEAGFTLRVTDASGKILPGMAGDRWAAVPFLRRADYGEYRNLPSTDAVPLKRDPRDIEYDFPLRALLDQPGFEYIPQLDVMNFDPKRVASSHRFSEAWAWIRDQRTMGVFTFNQEHMVFATVTPHDSPAGKFLRFGGSCLLHSTLSALRSVAPGQSVDLGLTRYQSIEGGYNETAYAYRSMLDEKGCRFPADYNPPVHWEQYYEMSIIPGDRSNVYTRAALEEQAAKGVEFSCEALYLDPGWDTSFGSFIWGSWLGGQKEFFDLLRTKYGLAAGLHFPMPPWASPSEKNVSEWPEACRRQPNRRLATPAVRDGRRNLALAPTARADASSVIPGVPIHQIQHLNDGYYGNPASWIAESMPAWAQIDLGAVYEVSRVVVGNDHAGQFTDRSATRLKVLGATVSGEKSEGANWRVLAERSQPLKQEAVIDFPPAQTRWIRVEIPESQAGEARLDEIEIYEAQPALPAEAEKYAQRICGARRLCRPSRRITLGFAWARNSISTRPNSAFWKCCDAGAVFLMFDGNWWNGGCVDPRTAIPCPTARKITCRRTSSWPGASTPGIPKVLIEMHDMLAGGEWRTNDARLLQIRPARQLRRELGLRVDVEPAWKTSRKAAPTPSTTTTLGCNVPIYLHVTLRRRQRTLPCRCGGMPRPAGTWASAAQPKNPAVVKAQQEAMKQYRQCERFYKRGEFYGIERGDPLARSARKNAFTVNVFNLSGAKKNHQRQHRPEDPRAGSGAEVCLRRRTGDGRERPLPGSNRTAALGSRGGSIGSTMKRNCSL